MRLGDSQSVLFGGQETPFIFVDVDVVEVDVDGAITLRFSTDGASSEYRFLISDKFQMGYEHQHLAGPAMRFKRGRNEAVDMAEYLEKDPLIIRYADGTYSYNCYHIAAKIEGGLFSRDRLEAWDWTGIPLNKESMHKQAEQATIQYRTYEKIRDEHNLVFNDDGHGEEADLVCLKEVDDKTIRLTLIHCKGAHKGKVTKDIRNFYVVCGQAQKNITAKHKGIPHLYRDLKRRHEAWAKTGATRFLKGDLRTFAYFKEKSRKSKLEFEVVLVQPGGSIRDITEDSLRLLATTEVYLKKTTEATFRVIISP
jgi:hypothetical protein